MKIESTNEIRELWMQARDILKDYVLSYQHGNTSWGGPKSLPHQSPTLYFSLGPRFILPVLYANCSGCKQGSNKSKWVGVDTPTWLVGYAGLGVDGFKYGFFFAVKWVLEVHDFDIRSILLYMYCSMLRYFVGGHWLHMTLHFIHVICTTSNGYRAFCNPRDMHNIKQLQSLL